jgi:indole-3-glycerol phosphate synthase
VLDVILDHKRREELPKRKRAKPLHVLRCEAEALPQPARDFVSALCRTDGLVALIAEVKRASPSKGELVRGPFNPSTLAQIYAQNGASAMSVLTDEQFFKGGLEHLRQVRACVALPLLRKDFIVDPYQIYEARLAGADAVLLIVAALDDALLRDLIALTHALTLTPLVEVHDEQETERALAADARVIGVNNRNLHTFVTDTQTTARCARLVPKDGIHVLVSESGIFTREDVMRAAEMGAHAVLVGESIVTASDVAAQVRTLSGVRRPIAASSADRGSQ